MRFRLLGPLRAWDGAGWREVAAAQQRVVLAVLLAERGRVVTVDRLVEEVWGTHPPRTALNTVQAYVMRLRRMLGPGTSVPLVAQGRGYALEIGAEDVDAAVFDRLTAGARDRLAGQEWAAAAAQLTEALALWQGPAFADVAPSLTVIAERTRLDRLRLAATTDRLGALLEMGRPAEVIDEGYRLVRDHPLEERIWALTMRALQSSGRRVEALETYRAARRALVAELGLEPGEELRDLHRSILGDEAPPAAAVIVRGPRPARPAQLPADVAGFTGRASHLRRLGQSGAVVALTGAAGIGKTALAVRWAHQFKDRFPDGQLWVDLRGYAVGRPVWPLEALSRFLAALGVGYESIPGTEEAAASMYRGLMADRQMLVVLDNAREPGQVRPLLPDSSGCVTLVTSRDQLRDLVSEDGARPVPVGQLSPVEAGALLSRLVGGRRIGAEPRAAAELGRLCGYQPLALRIAAANLQSNPQRTVAGYVERLAGGDRLDALQVDGDPQATVRAAFDLSYLALPAGARRLFRLLGLVPGPDVTAGSAAALADLGPDVVAPLLDLLATAHLVDEHAPGRYACHDLLRAYAARQAAVEESGPDRNAALDRLLRYYLGMVDAAARLLYPVTLRLPVPPVEPDRRERFGDHTQASAWLEAERANLVSAVLHAAEHGQRPAAWRLADALRGYLQMRSRMVDWRAVSQAGLAAATADGDAQAQAAAHLSMATLHLLQNRYRPAIEQLGSALEFARTAGWIRGQSGIHGNLGVGYQMVGEYGPAAEHLRLALALDRQIGWSVGQAAKLHNLGLLYAALGQLRVAAEHHLEAYHAFRQLGSRAEEAVALAGVGRVRHQQGLLDEAMEMLTRALDMHREVGDRASEYDVIGILSRVNEDLGRYPEALELAGTGVEFAREAGERQLELTALATRARIRCRLGEVDAAVEGHRGVIKLAREVDNRHAETQAHADLATAAGYAGRLDEAAGHAAAGLTLARTHGFQALEGVALTALAAVQLRRGQTAHCVASAERALAVYAQTGQRLGEARARLVLAAALARAGSAEAAAEQRAAAADAFRETGAPEADEARVLTGHCGRSSRPEVA